MKMTGLIKLVKSRSGILSALVAVLCGLLLGLIACHLYNLKKIEGFSSHSGTNETTYTLDVKLDNNDHKALKNIHDKLTGSHSPVQPHASTEHHGSLLDSHSSKTHSNKASKASKASKGSKTSTPKHISSEQESPGTKVQMDADSLNDFYNQLPQGISRNNIPAGDEDLYILKSEIVPPVCPACPTFDCPREKPCPPCPACERCPEPAFECKKVPNYNVSNVDEYLPSASNYFSMSNIDNKQPRPLLNDFSQFN